MFIAMNRFRVIKGCEADFEHVWLSRDTHLDKVPGFTEFHLLKGTGVGGPHTLRIAHGVAEPRRLRSMDPVGSVPRRACKGRRQQAALSRPPAIRGFRDVQTVGGEVGVA